MRCVLFVIVTVDQSQSLYIYQTIYGPCEVFKRFDCFVFLFFCVFLALFFVHLGTIYIINK